MNNDWFRDLKNVTTREMGKIISMLFSLDKFGENAYESHYYSQIYALAYLDTNFALILNDAYGSINDFYPTEKGVYNSEQFLETIEAWKQRELFGTIEFKLVDRWLSKLEQIFINIEYMKE
ncbi:MAG: hypothetical protein AB8G05_06810 [Oligoflexales bacterium]